MKHEFMSQARIRWIKMQQAPGEYRGTTSGVQPQQSLIAAGNFERQNLSDKFTSSIECEPAVFFVYFW